ncbi:hypothetical protein TW95_gp1398 [Pandoravirus inopinatum]|uniref:Uncharacterized protein n=1 Tax=Pandoravirus inopinatum TaxID=1605721 RepID=A0A0B5JEC9_9VIRU|nr:hypothetical protein TW95_gp1398 [Pandoravirus inopinatum]AJF98132.1 hypothetical protein [Pandoravirus inopinatum]
MAVHEAQHYGTHAGDVTTTTTADAGYSAEWRGDAPDANGQQQQQQQQRTWLDVAEAAAFDAHAVPHGDAGQDYGDNRASDTAANQHTWSQTPASSSHAPPTTHYQGASTGEAHSFAPAPATSTHAGAGSSGHRTDERYAAEAEDPATIERQAKHAALLNLQLLVEKGVKLSRTFTMEDSHYDMEYEWDAYHHRVNHLESIRSVHENIDFAKGIVTLINAVGGRFLKRKGGIIPPGVLKSKWEKAVAEHNGTIEALARKYYGPHAGSSAQSPEIRIAKALAISIGGTAAMSLCGAGFLLGDDDGGGGGGDDDRDSRDRRRRRRDDRRPTLRKHRDAATSDATGWRDAFGHVGTVPYPQPPTPATGAPDQEPFSRAPPVGGAYGPPATPSAEHASHGGGGGAFTPHAAAPAQPTPWSYGDPSTQPLAHHYPPQQTAPPSTTQPTPQMDPYAAAGAASPGTWSGAPSWSPQHQVYTPGQGERPLKAPTRTRGHLVAAVSRGWRTWAPRREQPVPHPSLPPVRPRLHAHTNSRRAAPRQAVAPWVVSPSRAKFVVPFPARPPRTLPAPPDPCLTRLDSKI